MTGFKPGDRVHERGHDYTPSTTGTVQGTASDGRIKVLWDDGPVITPHLPQHLEPLGEPMSKRTDFLDADGSPMTIEGRADHKNWAIKFASTYREFTPADAPTLALAILEAAGVQTHPYDGATSAQIALGHLREHVGIEAVKAKAAADRVKLESEAVQLLCKVKGWEVAPFASFGSVLQTKALELACFARELHGVTA